MANNFLSLDESLNIDILEKVSHLNSLFSNHDQQDLGQNYFMSPAFRFNFEETEQNPINSALNSVDFNGFFQENPFETANFAPFTTENLGDSSFDFKDTQPMKNSVTKEETQITEINFAHDAGYSVNLPDAIAVNTTPDYSVPDFNAPEFEFSTLPFESERFIEEPQLIYIEQEIEISYNFEDLMAKTVALDEHIMAATGYEIQSPTWDIQVADSSYDFYQSSNLNDNLLNEDLAFTEFDQGTSLGLENTYIQ